MRTDITSTVGRTVPRTDARDKVRGKEEFVADMDFPRMLHGAVVRSARPHARIVRIDTSKAEEITGVAAVLTAKDIPGENVIPVIFRDQPLLAGEVVRYIGEPVALVAADTFEHARRAALAVEIEYEDLAPVFDLMEARNHDSARVFADDNVFKYLPVIKGDIEKGFGECDVIVENEYRTPPQEHAYLETQGAIAVPRQAGVTQVFGSMQCPFYVRDAVATVLGIPLSNTHIVQTSTGGAFGGKEDVPSLLASQAGLLAYHTQRPVKLIYTRDEDIAVTSKRHASYVRSKYGATKDGILRAAQVEYIIDGGAYATLSPVVLFRGVMHAVGPYRCPHVKIDGYAVATNNVPAGAFRGFGSPQVLFAAERQMSELARALELDAVEFRRRNLLRKGDATITNQVLPWSVGAMETLEKAVEVSGWEDKRPVTRHPTPAPTGSLRSPAATISKSEIRNPKSEILRGIGVSTICYGVGLGAGGEYLARTGAVVKINEDGSVDLAVGTTEMGQGMKTVLSQIVAETLGAPMALVHILPTDTTRVPDSGPTVASRATTMSGRAAQNAALILHERLIAVAAEMLGAETAAITLRDGVVFNGEQGTNLTFKKVVQECAKQRVSLSTAGWHHPEHLEFDWKTGQGDAYNVYAFATNIAEVEVDTQTGHVKVLRIVAAHDVGKAVNPQMVEGQIEGGTLQGVGYALYEEVVRDRGEIRNPNFSTYIIPTAADAPKIVPIIVEDPYPDGPFGAKGFGEQPLMGVAPAIVNAVCNALGVSLNQIPLTPERVWMTLAR